MPPQSCRAVSTLATPSTRTSSASSRVRAYMAAGTGQDRLARRDGTKSSGAGKAVAVARMDTDAKVRAWAEKQTGAWCEPDILLI